MFAAFVKDSVHIWPSIGKAHVKKSDKDEATVWNNVPQEIRDGRMYTTGREIDLYDIVYILFIPEGNPCNLKKQEHKNSKSPSSQKKKNQVPHPYGDFLRTPDSQRDVP